MDVALLLIDVVNPMNFDGAEDLMPHAMRAAEAIAALKHRAHVARIPIVYVNDNYGRWHLGFRELVTEFRAERVPGVPLIDRLAPNERTDHFVLKPLHSGFYGTSLDVLLHVRGVRRLVLTGFAGNICVFFTANDAHMRGYEIAVPADCVASETTEDNDYALRQMARVLGADVRPSPSLDLVGNGLLGNGRRTG
jgi:nicotinamidase-related amidase